MSIRGLKKKLLTVASLSVLSAFSTANAQQGELLSQKKANIDSEVLSPSLRGASPEANIRAYLRQRGANIETVNSLSPEASFTAPDGKRFVNFEQRINGLRVHGALTKAAFNANGDLIHMIERLASGNQSVAQPSLDDSEALRIAIDRNFAGAPVPALQNVQGAVRQFADNSFFYKAPTVERVIVAQGNSLQEGFLVVTWSADDNMLYHTVVNGLGQIVENELRTNEDRYRVYPVHPGVSGQQIIQGPGAGNAQSPNGWLFGTQRSIQIQGNNVRAYLDRDNNNSPDGGGFTISNDDFLATANLSQQPTTTQNQEVAVQNLFYLNNIIHDELYRHGFTEGARNFQENNFGRGGNGSDSVNAEAQDGGSTNNANFATPGDGSNPRMQMYIWTRSNPSRDGDIDSDIVWHEYGHGLTWRMIGSMSGSVSGAIGEGMSDTIAIIYNNQDAVAEYSNNRAAGIRSSRYTNHPDTIGDFNGGRGVHRNGEIIGATMWDMWQRYQNAGFSRDNVLDDIVGGMNFIAPGPDYFDMRDGFLAQAPSNRDCLVWEAFAARGMGEGGSMNSTGSSINESFTVPASCSGNPPPPPPTNTPPNAVISSNTTSGNAPLTVNFNGSGSSDSDGAIASYAWDFDGNGSTDSTAANPSFTYQNAGSFTARLTVTDDDGATDSATTLITVNQTTPPPPSGTFEVGANVDVTRTDFVRSNPGGAKISLQREGASGVIVGGPFPRGNKIWWNIDFASGADGWFLESRLEVTSGSPPPPPPGNTPPSADISATPTNGNAPLNVNFSGSGSTDSDGNIVSYAWDFDDNGSTDATGVNANFTYQTTGNFTARLTVTDDDGATDTATQVISVGQTPPPPPPGGSFEVGALIEVSRTDFVRANPGGAKRSLQRRGSQGVIVGGPAANDGRTWWNVNFDTGDDGWITEDRLSLR